MKTLSLAFQCDYLCWISVTYFKLSANMRRKPIGQKVLTKAEKERRCHQKLSAVKKAKIAKEDKEQKKLKRALIKLEESIQSTRKSKEKTKSGEEIWLKKRLMILALLLVCTDQHYVGT